MAYRDFKDLARRAGSDKILGDKAYNITKNPKYDGYVFAKLCALRACVSTWSTCHRVCMLTCLTCQRACVPMCQCVPTSHYVPTCQ